MRKVSCSVLIAIALLLGSAAPGDARGYRGHGGAHVWVGPGIWWGSHAFWGPFWWGHPYPYSAGPPVVIQQPAPINAEPAPPAPEPYYWYYCQERQAYYPYVQQCPNGWMKVVPPVPAPGQ